MRVSRKINLPFRPTPAHLPDFRIVEYATREQAQNAVNTLSNQNLMGRLVYVREVRPLLEGPCSRSFATPSIGDKVARSYDCADRNRVRIVRSNLALLDQPGLEEATKELLLVAATQAVSAEQVQAVVAADVSSMCLTSVFHYPSTVEGCSERAH